MKSIAIIGSGKIGSGILKAVKGNYPSIRIIATGRRDETIENVKRMGVEATKDNDYAVREAEVIVLTVKPQHFPVVLRQVNKDSWMGKIVISVMAGIKVSTLSSLIPNAEVYRAMPNINALVNRSTTAIAERDGRGKEYVESIFKSLGSVYWVPEDMLDAWTALIGSGPAFISEIIDAFALGAVACGMPRDLAYYAILDMIEGTIKMLKSNLNHPVMLRDQVTTPAGTTIRGLMVMESEGVKSALIKTIESAYQRAYAIGEEIDKRLRESNGK
ncbi:pyrroline-5-carboxylate reductase [Sulfolobus sp. A20]|uniref:pyrroline-5-carboxylate reductase n=1 Tax=Saccharolobus sp. A20 TaxID=1891280 RepID=UPI000845F29F|nr:pyrroline-5-carboxylate reductase [Sulfolobus sp. A20]TRM75595.1 pyrroline-5-carboxylate reductase [Sulfolobus sp. A20-N-F8]TRM78026.1 pyrroline-5-carboxylate reductase [Sulfolobus sp. B5]TRM86367.1 pyrroline-5-carboxylate reductase [Sulfolobus sp. E3]TRN01120.1 pyrroline-5-carboxylate reductase [Sulfolobus sp. F1]TRN04605.1 pyrroline-5-carboxylate reductase [Sulfolobus sp. E1]